MREIKFKCWHKIARSWVPMGVYSLAIFESPEERAEFNRYHELVQYTGLKDKNGNEIYEGGIVEIRMGGMGIGSTYPVVWDNDDLTYKVGAAMLGGMDVEIIGNIYEHPELLNGGSKNV